jgi:uncharacterized protein with ATP-grasp and redox domains
VDSTHSEEVVKDACSIISSGLGSDVCSADLATRVHWRTFEILGSVDPYKEIKASAMAIGKQLEGKAKSLIDKSPEPLQTAILISIVGNVLDFGISGGMTTPDELVASFDRIYQEGLGHDDTDKLKDYLKTDAKILFFADNCGEIVFDKLLCKELKKFGVRITLVVKREPILSDVTLTEAEQIGMIEVVDEIITTGGYAVGIDFNNISNELNERLQNFDIIISKGMANYESLSEFSYKPIIYLARTKCVPVAKSLGLPKNLNVAKLFE